MCRFLLAFVRSRNSDLEFSLKIFKVSDDCSPYDVTVPMNTLVYMFATTNIESAKKLTESFVTFKLGKNFLMHCSEDLTFEKNMKRYWVGKLVRAKGEYKIYNEHVGSLIPITCLAENDEIIDL